MNVNAIERKRRRKNIESIMQVFLTSNKRNSKEYVLILFIYSTLNITKKGKGGKKENFAFIYARNMPSFEDRQTT